MSSVTKSAALHLWAFFYPKSGANAVEDVGMVIHERKKVIHERKRVIREHKKVIHEHKHRVQAQCGKQLREAVISDIFFVMCAFVMCASALLCRCLLYQ